MLGRIPSQDQDQFCKRNPIHVYSILAPRIAQFPCRPPPCACANIFAKYGARARVRLDSAAAAARTSNLPSPRRTAANAPTLLQREGEREGESREAQVFSIVQSEDISTPNHNFATLSSSSTSVRRAHFLCAIPRLFAIPHILNGFLTDVNCSFGNIIHVSGCSRLGRGTFMQKSPHM